MWKEDVFFLLENPALRSTEKLVQGWPRLPDLPRQVRGAKDFLSHIAISYINKKK